MPFPPSLPTSGSAGSSLYNHGVKFIWHSVVDGNTGTLAAAFGGPEPNGWFKGLIVRETMGEQLSFVEIAMEIPFEHGHDVIAKFTTGDAVEIEYGYFPHATRTVIAKANAYPDITMGMTTNITWKGTGMGSGLMKARNEAIIVADGAKALPEIVTEVCGLYGISEKTIVFKDLGNEDIIAAVEDPYTALDDPKGENPLPDRTGNDYEWLQKLCSDVGCEIDFSFDAVTIAAKRGDVEEEEPVALFKLFGSFKLDDSPPQIPIQECQYNASYIMKNNSPAAFNYNIHTGEMIGAKSEEKEPRGDKDTSQGASHGDGAGNSADGEINDPPASSTKSGQIYKEKDAGKNSANGGSSLDDVGLSFSTVGYPYLTARSIVNMTMGEDNRLNGDYQVKEITNRLGMDGYMMDVQLCPMGTN